MSIGVWGCLWQAQIDLQVKPRQCQQCLRIGTSRLVWQPAGWSGGRPPRDAGSLQAGTCCGVKPLEDMASLLQWP